MRERLSGDKEKEMPAGVRLSCNLVEIIQKNEQILGVD